MFEILIGCAVLGLVPAVIARAKGHSFLAWWLCGAGLFIVALPASILIKPATGSNDITGLAPRRKKCPFCAEFIKPEARVCRFCGREVSVSSGERRIHFKPRHATPAATAPAIATVRCPHCQGGIFSAVANGKNLCPHCKRIFLAEIS